MRRNAKFEHPRLLSPERKESYIVPGIGDEIYCGGVFHFNVSAILSWLKHHPQPTIEVPVNSLVACNQKEDCYVEVADLSRPILLAEIAPDYRDFIPNIPENDWASRGYVCIDGQHRLEKARRVKIKSLPAIVLRMEQHIPFIFKGYQQYVDYWNRKLCDRTSDAERWHRSNAR